MRSETNAIPPVNPTAVASARISSGSDASVVTQEQTIGIVHQSAGSIHARSSVLRIAPPSQANFAIWTRHR